MICQRCAFASLRWLRPTTLARFASASEVPFGIAKDAKPRDGVKKREEMSKEEMSKEGQSRPHSRSFRSVCPFTVHRTASDNIPVYVTRRKNRTEDVTVVKKVRGDREALKREIEFLCGTRASYGKSGFLEVVGNHRRAIKGYLRSIGY
ncbi:unnamed protein product [Effrenium voratum]|nr:unnamed protein product [Effrenium voratum]